MSDISWLPEEVSNAEPCTIMVPVNEELTVYIQWKKLIRTTVWYGTYHNHRSDIGRKFKVTRLVDSTGRAIYVVPPNGSGRPLMVTPQVERAINDACEQAGLANGDRAEPVKPTFVKEPAEKKSMSKGDAKRKALEIARDLLRGWGRQLNPEEYTAEAVENFSVAKEELIDQLDDMVSEVEED